MNSPLKNLAKFFFWRAFISGIAIERGIDPDEVILSKEEYDHQKRLFKSYWSETSEHRKNNARQKQADRV